MVKVASCDVLYISRFTFIIPINFQAYTWQCPDHKRAGVDDMTLLSDLTDSAIVDNLKRRFDCDWIFTSELDIIKHSGKSIDTIYKNNLPIRKIYFSRIVLRNWMLISDIGTVLISVNPFKQMKYFTQREVDMYQGAVSNDNWLAYLFGKNEYLFMQISLKHWGPFQDNRTVFIQP